MTESQEKRIEPRYEVSSKVPAIWSGRSAPLECAASDISKHGIFLEMEAPPPLETIIHVGPFDAAVKGRVVFSLAPADATAIGRKAGVGVQLDTAIAPDTFLLRCAEARAALLAVGEGAGPMLATSAVRPAAAPASRPRVAAPGSSPGMSAPPSTGARRAEAPADVVADVVIVDGVAGQEVLAQALVTDGYTPLIAAHGLEALVLCIKRRPLLCVAGVNAARLGGRRLIDEVRGRAELAYVALVLVDESDAPDPNIPATFRWRAAPPDVDRARRFVDASMGTARPGARSRGPDDARVLADAVAELARRLGAEGAIDDAVTAIRYAAELAPTVSSHTLFLARILLTSPDVRQRDEAAGLIERIARQDPRSPETFLLRAVVLDQRGRKDHAKDALKRTLMFEPDNTEALAAMKALESGQPLVEIREAGPEQPAEKAKSSGRFSISKLFRR